eukprot:CAMPEP_0170515644 /NCGR_PEP_ID=MMETSP0209-20121228/2058_1 /TAXON_ID=665100 ORGANISM="Litonotus pictus, Strain P1" /NCGR_SAMPLE_ID=MMETSP0209 /ASSEMBLY_ACC=CAM_ASM_000301 /LENGTH=226 /DNA_ID=CAMNT_0010800227 /DNA_START=537 /DNA_END=1217 /DNA_ORIENTATION=+
MSSFDLFQEEELAQVIESFRSLYEIVICPIIINQDIIADRICQSFSKLDLLDFKNSNYTASFSEMYLSYLLGLGQIKQEFDLSLNSEKLLKLSYELKDEQFASLVDSQLNNLKKVYETLHFYQKQEKSKNKEAREQAETQIKMANEYLRGEAVLNFVNSQADYLKKVSDLKFQIVDSLKSLDIVVKEIKAENVGCVYYENKEKEIRKRAEIAKQIADSFINIKLLF